MGIALRMRIRNFSMSREVSLPGGLRFSAPRDFTPPLPRRGRVCEKSGVQFLAVDFSQTLSVQRVVPLLCAKNLK